MNDEHYMNQALQLAKNTLGQTDPNPVVGAVIVKAGEVVGFGAHLQSGTAHAEIHALKMAGDAAHGGTMYVTLEPCSHYGKTPPCVEAIIKQGIHRVVVATKDPFEKVSGSGVQTLRSAGIEIDVGLKQAEADDLNRKFFTYVKEKRPYVTVKTAMTLDGRTMTSTGESQWITGKEARQDGHVLRHQHQAILVGMNTVLNDDPQLTTRLPNGGTQPIRVIIDRHLRIHKEAKLLDTTHAETWLITSHDIDCEKINQLKVKERGLKVIQVTDPYDLPNVMAILAREGVVSLLVEGGETIIDQFLIHDLIDEWVSYIAPKLIGGQSQSKGREGITRLSDHIALDQVCTDIIGEDLKITARRRGS